jgi:hypothetical protein
LPMRLPARQRTTDGRNARQGRTGPAEPSRGRNAGHARTGWRGYFNSSAVHMTNLDARPVTWRHAPHE